jgi:prevent-host-death family protein
MQTIDAFEAKTHFSALLEQVEQMGIQIIITKHGRPVAKLVPITNIDRAQKSLAIEALKIFHQGRTLGQDWKALRDEGRR